jgi:hypothetical protein
LDIDLINNINLLDEIKEYIEIYQDWFNGLSLLKQGAVTHILVSVTVLLLLSSLTTIHYSDVLIKYFHLETKYPRLAKYIMLRRKFQNYYFFLNTLGIVIALIAIIVINIFIFIKF